ncbi:hypothetical protein [Gemmobacter sp.]|uniref:hypothetical protein n=1 Tax=Gemmobacter sp. TaxID=1898957 RepID=UPI002AFDD0B2|nr:hypothetical protein [Gemmobacter sp.]
MPDRAPPVSRLTRLRGHVVRYILGYVWLHLPLTVALALWGGAGGLAVRWRSQHWPGPARWNGGATPWAKPCS